MQGSEGSSTSSSQPLGKRAVREAREDGEGLASESREAHVMVSEGETGHSVCGNGIIEEKEECDGGNLGKRTCQSLNKTP